MEEVFRKWAGEVHSGTDKGTTHAYLEEYEKVFSPRRADKIRLLEIGVYTGASLNAWADYFTNDETEIVGIDINPYILKFKLDNPKIKMHVGNATIKADLEKIEGTFDFIIDDGSHALRDQMVSFVLLNSRLNAGGAYIIEDIQSMDDVHILQTAAEEAGWTAKLVDTRAVKGRYDDLMLVITK